MTRKILTCFLLLTSCSVLASDEATQAPPDSIFTSNVAIDVLVLPGSVWLATDEGVNYTLDNGVSWLRYDNSNGLAGNNISALGASGARIWVASGHSAVVGGESVSLSDGLQFTDDMGNNWTLIDFDAQNIDYATGGDRTIYDITTYAGWLFASGFAAGLLSTNDGGTTWSRVFGKAADSINYYNGHLGLEDISLQNRQFSCAVDTSHFGDPLTAWDDSLVVWTGTAGGLYQMFFADKHAKPQSRYVNDIAFCNSCQADDSNYVFIGSDNGLTRGLSNAWSVAPNAVRCLHLVHPRVHGGPYISRFADDPNSLSYDNVVALHEMGGTLFISTSDSSAGRAAIQSSDDNGETTAFAISWPGEPFTDFEEIGGRLYAVSKDSLAVSGDTTINLVKAIDFTGGNAVASISDTMLIGCDSGLWVVQFDSLGLFVDSLFETFAEDDSTSRNVIDVEIQRFLDTTGAIVESTVVWTVNRPATALGHPFVGRYHLDSLGTGAQWQRFLVDTLTFDLDAVDSVVYMGGGKGIFRFSSINDNTAFDGDLNYLPVYSSLPGYNTDSLHADTVTTVEVKGNVVYLGTKNGIALSVNAGQSFDIVRPNLSPMKPDSAMLFTVANSFLNCDGTTGFFSNWIPAMDVQYLSNGGTAVWTSNRSTGTGVDTLGFGICRSYYDSVGSVVNINGVDRDSISSVQFELYYQDGFAWNFAFYGDTVFAATDGGLIYNTSGEKFDWDTLNFVDADGIQQVLPNVPVYGVAVDGDQLWVVTDDRTIRIDLNTLLVERTFYVSDLETPTDQVYAFPVPYSHTTDYGLDFHFVVDNDAEVTLEIYDFAMNLVRRVIDHKSYAAGVYPTSGSDRVVWDGKNGKGDDAAVGVYYFKVSYSTGEERWGKLAVIP